MPMSEIANAMINTFGITSPKADVSPEEPIFVLSSSQLQEIITRAIQPLQDEVQSLKDTNARLEDKVSALEATQDTQGENELNMLRLINDLRKDREPQPLQRNRGEILRALLVANGGKMLAKDARQKMHLGKEQFSLLISKMGEYIEAKSLHSDNRKKILVLRTS
jgi:hypothetical protein